MDSNRDYPSIFFALSGRNLMLKQILSEAIILPVEESWELICNSSFVGNINPVTINNFENTYSNGVIIKPK